MASFLLRWLNPIVIGVYMAGLMATGLYFSRRQTTTDQYFVAGRSIPGWAMGVSLLATIITSLTFIAYPGAAYAGNWSLIMPGVMMLVVPATLGLVIVPFFRKVVRMSAFEYFGKRFGHGVRLYSSAMFALGHFSKMAFVLYLLALTVNSMTGWNSSLVLLVTTCITVIYAFVGGLEAIIWADVFQGILLWVGALIAVAFLLHLTPAPPSAIFHAAFQAHKFNLGSPKLDFHKPTLIVLLLYGTFTYLQKYTADQTVIQRYLAARSDREALRGVLLGAGLCLPVWALFMVAGTLLWGYYKFSHELLPGYITKGDQVFPYFLSTHLPPGVGGIFLAALFGAGMAMLASDLNCLATVVIEDFYRHWNPAASDRQSLRLGRVCVVMSGAGGFAGAWILTHSQGAALSLYYAVNSIVAGGLAGIFFLAFLCRRATRRGVHIAIAVNLLFTVWATLTAGAKPWIDMKSIRFTWHEYMIGVLGQIIIVVVGYGASAVVSGKLHKTPRQDSSALTVWGWLRQRQIEEV